MFSCEFCEISKNSFFTEHLRTTASDLVFQKQPPKVLFQKSFTGKHLWRAKFLRTSFLQDTSGRLLLLLNFQKQPLEALSKISQNSQENAFGLRNFQKHLFYGTPLDDCFWLFHIFFLSVSKDNQILGILE